MPDTTRHMTQLAVDTARLLYRNQFVLGPRHLEFPGWSRIQVRPSLVITAHPDLLWCQAASEGRSLTLLGFMLDPDEATRSDQEIVDDLIRAPGLGGLLEATYKYGGRWALIAADGDQVVVFNDAAGMRQVFYATDEQAVWCASQPAMLAQILGREMAADAMDFIDSFAFRTNREYWWPGDGSPFQGVKHLLPNHTLDLVRGTAQRFWPDRELAPLPLEEAVAAIAHTLRGLVTSAAHRFDLAVAVTAGWDSRLAVAASRGVADRIAFVTVRQLLMRDDHPDLTVAAALLRRLGLAHDVVRSTPVVDPEFARIFRANYVLAHDHYAPDAHALFRYSGGRKAIVTGSISEVIRDPTLGRPPIRGQTSDREIATAWYGAGHPYAVGEIGRWRANLGSLYNVSPDIVFYWEQRAGNWVAMNQLEFDAAWRENVALYNCRALLVTMLRVDEQQRRGILYRRVAEHLWPEVMSEPVNPHKTKTLGMRLEARLKRLGRAVLRRR